MDKFNHLCTYAYVRSTCALRSAAAKLKERVDKVVNDESGMEIIAVILILVVVLGIAVIFREQISEFVNKIFDRIAGDTEKLGDGGFNRTGGGSGGGAAGGGGGVAFANGGRSAGGSSGGGFRE